jgi:hypothetical protein
MQSVLMLVQMYPCTYVHTYIPTMLTSLHDDLMLHFVINLASPYYVAPNKRRHTIIQIGSL